EAFAEQGRVLHLVRRQALSRDRSESEGGPEAFPNLTTVFGYLALSAFGALPALGSLAGDAAFSGLPAPSAFASGRRPRFSVLGPPSRPSFPGAGFSGSGAFGRGLELSTRTFKVAWTSACKRNSMS